MIDGEFILKKNHLQDLLSILNALVSTNESTWIFNRSWLLLATFPKITDLKSHMTCYKLNLNWIFFPILRKW